MANAIYFICYKRFFNLIYREREREGDYTKSGYAMAIPKSFMITMVINVNDTRPVAFQSSTFVRDNSAKSKSTSATFYE